MPIKEFKDGTKWNKATYWEEGMNLKGKWLVLRKIDGVRMIRNKFGQVMSRDEKPLYNASHLEFSDAEFFIKDWNTSVSVARTARHEEYNVLNITQENVYELSDGKFDPRLFICELTDPTDEQLLELMQKQLDVGDEGLVIRQGIKWLKVVPTIFADVRVTGVKQGTGRLGNVLGSIQTNHGSVGSIVQQKNSKGQLLSDYLFRECLWDNRDKLVGMIIQVGYREITDKGKMRFPKFIRLRKDKDVEDLPWLKS